MASDAPLPKASHYIERLVEQLERENDSMVQRMAEHGSDWLPEGTLFPSNAEGIRLSKQSFARRVHDDGTDRTFLPFKLADPGMLEVILGDSEEVASWQAGVCAFTRSVIPLLDHIDKEFLRIRNENLNRSNVAVTENVYHIGLAYRAIKHELRYVLESHAIHA